MAVADDRGYPQPMVGSYSGDALLWHGGLSDDRRDLDLASEPRHPLRPPGKRKIHSPRVCGAGGESTARLTRSRSPFAAPSP
jgi:hypothetical protein